MKNKNLLLLVALIALASPWLHAQSVFDSISQTVIRVKSQNRELAGKAILLDLKDYSGSKSYYPSIQMIDAETGTTLWYKSDTSFNGTFLAPHVNADGVLSYFFGTSGSNPSGNFFMDMSTLTVTGTQGMYYMFTGDTFFTDVHDFQRGANGTYLVLGKKTYLENAKCFFGNKDTMITVWGAHIVILDSTRTKELFVYDARESGDFKLSEMYFEDRGNSLNSVPGLDWSHANSCRWANDGNILYGFRFVGQGKIKATGSPHDPSYGHVMWKLGGKDTLNPHFISIPDIAGIAKSNKTLAHCFDQASNGDYLMHTGGDSLNQFSGSLELSINELNYTAQVVASYPDQVDSGIFSKGQNSYSIFAGIGVSNYGIIPAIKGQTQAVQQLGTIVENGQVIATIERLNFQCSYSMILMRTASIPTDLVPKVQTQEDTLVAVHGKNLFSPIWYKTDDPFHPIRVGTGEWFVPSHPGQYRVDMTNGVINSVSFPATTYLAVTGDSKGLR